MYTHLPTGERLTCRKCGAGAWCTPTTEGLEIRCPTCGSKITGVLAEGMCSEQRLYVEAVRYKERVNQAGSECGIPVPESVNQHREQLLPGDREAYPVHIEILDPNWPFRYSADPDCP